MDSLVLHSERLILRQAEKSDAVSILSYYITNKKHLTPFEPVRSKEFYSQTYWIDQIKLDMENFQNDQSVKFWMFEKENPTKVIGVVNFSNIVRGVFQACYLGFSLAEDKQGRGYMTEALETTIDYIFNKMNIHRIMANCMAKNNRSLAVLEKIGFTREGIAKKYLMINGVWENHVLTSLTNKNYKLV